MSKSVPPSALPLHPLDHLVQSRKAAERTEMHDDSPLPLDPRELAVLNRHGRCAACRHFTLLHLDFTNRRGVTEKVCQVLSCPCSGEDHLTRTRAMDAQLNLTPRVFGPDETLPKVRFIPT